MAEATPLAFNAFETLRRGVNPRAAPGRSSRGVDRDRVANDGETEHTHAAWRFAAACDAGTFGIRAWRQLVNPPR